MTLKHILYTSSAALAMLAPTLVTGVVANAATSTPAQTTHVTQNNNKRTNKQAARTAASTSQKAASTNNNNNHASSKKTAKTDATQPASKIDFGSFKISTPTKVSQDYTHKALRYTGSSYTDANKGYTSSVTATQNNSTLNYQVSTYDSNGNSSTEPFAVKIYKNGSLYKTFTSTTGAAKGSLNVDKGTYTIQVLTSASAHYTGGLSLS